MRDEECVRFLQGVLPSLGLRWAGYRKVRRQVCKRLARRIAALGLDGLAAYREYLDRTPAERAVLDALCLIPISRFYRDRGVWERLRAELLPALAAGARARGAAALRCWSAGCASGEEPYTLALCWQLDLSARFPDIALDILATDAAPHLLDRARTACYGPGSLRDLPEGWVSRGFTVRGGTFCVKPAIRDAVTLELGDMRRAMPPGPFDLILCRNAVFTYCDETVRARVAEGLAARLRVGGLLVLGAHESVPEPDARGLRRIDRAVPVWRMEEHA